MRHHIQRKTQDFIRLIDENQLSASVGKKIEYKEEILDNELLTDIIQRTRAACDTGIFAGLYPHTYAIAHHQICNDYLGNGGHLAIFILNGQVARQFFDGVAVILNPRILSHDEEITEIREGCMSHPYRNERKVKRFTKIKVAFEDTQMKSYTKELTGIAARIFQHETDHTNGITIWKDKTYNR